MGIRTVFVFGSAGIEKAKSVGTSICGRSGVNLSYQISRNGPSICKTQSAGTGVASCSPGTKVSICGY